MSKRGGSQLLRKEAETIAKKLGAEISHGSKHMQAVIRYNGVLIARFGIRHDKKAPNGHIPSQLFMSARDTLEMAKCRIQKEDWIKILQSKNLLPT